MEDVLKDAHDAPPRSIRLGCDCAGLETPAMALTALQIPFVHIWSCDIDKNVRKQVMANWSPQHWYDDLLLRDPYITPPIDWYFCGWPCQPFSSAGALGSFDDGRGDVFFGAVRLMEVRRPTAFVLENVKNLISIDQGRAWHTVMHTLKNMGDGAYEIHWKIVDTQDHGVPQHRERVYIVGLLKSAKVGDFIWPETLPRVPLSGFLDNLTPVIAQRPKRGTVAQRNLSRVLQSIRKQGRCPEKEDIVVDIDASEKRCHYMISRSPTLLKSRGAGYWITSKARRMTTAEQARLQGMSPCFQQVVSDRIMGGQIGNAMSQNVLERLLIRLLPAAGLVPSSFCLADRWARAI